MLPADQLIRPNVEKALAELDPPPADAALVAIARAEARQIDSLAGALRNTLLPQHAGVLMRAMDQLEKRAAARRKPASSSGKRGNSELDKLRLARRKPA